MRAEGKIRQGKLFSSLNLLCLGEGRAIVRRRQIPCYEFGEISGYRGEVNEIGLAHGFGEISVGGSRRVVGTWRDGKLHGIG